MEKDIYQMGGGSELHRLKEMGEYDHEMFERLYRKVTPHIKKLSYNIDVKRYNLSKDIIYSFFVDKFIYVFNRYHQEYDEEHLKAVILNSLSTYRNKLLKNAYNDQAEYYQSLTSLDNCFDSDKELVEFEEEELMRSEKLNLLYDYMREKLRDDAYLLFEVLYNPPPYIKSRMTRQNSRITSTLIIEFFGLTRNKKSLTYIGQLKKEIEYYIEKAKEDLSE